MLCPPVVPSQAATPRYESRNSGPILREHIFTVRKFGQVTVPEGQMVGAVPLASLSTPRLALERGLKIPRTPLYDGTVYDGTWAASTSVSGYFGPPH